ncbi:MAG: septum formation initiator family protein [Deltaproteobacteria bacterium]|nr:septum formation initiator family protein [Deltaproteobacteria bacterium]
MIAWLGFGERGFIHLYRMEKERQAHLERITKIEEENRRLLEEIDRLRHDREYIEAMARRELGLIKDNEVLYRFDRQGEDVPSKAENGQPR